MCGVLVFKDFLIWRVSFVHTLVAIYVAVYFGYRVPLGDHFGKCPQTP